MNEHRGSTDDFDFLLGRWRVRNRRLRARHVGSDDWEEFEATSKLLKVLDGVVNIEEYDCPAKGFKGLSLRTLDQTTGTWSIYWLASTDGLLRPPVHGGFQGDHGAFFGEDMDGDRPVHCRFLWLKHATKPRWEQAFSTDGGASWETNWTMDLEALEVEVKTA